MILWLPVTVTGHTFDIFRNENNVYSRAVLHNDTDNVKVIPIHISPTQCTVFFLSVSDSPFHATLPPYPASFQKPWVCRVNRSRTWVVDPHTHSAKCFFAVLFIIMDEYFYFQTLTLTTYHSMQYLGDHSTLDSCEDACANASPKCFSFTWHSNHFVEPWRLGK